jgi:hypothetical protein
MLRIEATLKDGASVMRGNIVIAAALAGGGLVLASIILVVGLTMALNRSADRLADAVDRHANNVTSAGNAAGSPIAQALSQINTSVALHADAVATAGQMVSRPLVTMKSPVPIVDEQPLRIQGTVGVEMGENKESKQKNSDRK